MKPGRSLAPLAWSDLEELLETAVHESVLCLLATLGAIVCWLEDLGE